MHKPENKKARSNEQALVADWTGLEPATSAVTGRHSNQLNYNPKLLSKSGCKDSFSYPEQQTFLKKFFQKIANTVR